MDPNACLEMLRYHVREGEKAEARHLREALREWVDNGGFEPSDPTWRSA